MSVIDDSDLGDFFEGDGEQDPFGDKAYLKSSEKTAPRKANK